MANMASLSTDLKRAEQQVQTSTDKMGRNVATLESAFGKLGSTLSLGLAFEAVRRLSDDFVKLTAQIRIATKSQAEYAQGLSEIRRISTESQASITATGALYTRLTNSLGAFGATQKQVANITETVSLGLKAYGATSVEAASAMLQLSQAFASNRLGGDEFRAMMESMPNMMRTLAKSMGVPFEALKVLSAEGKITAKEMMKAWDDPALIASLQKQANMTRTITGEITVLRNNIMMLVGELMQTSNGTQGITAVLHAMSDVVLALAKHIDSLATYATITAALFAGKWLLAKQMAIRVSVAMREATVMEAAGEAALAKVALVASEQKAAAKQLEIYASREAFITTQAETKALLAGTLAAEARTAAEARLAGLIATVNAAEVEAIATERALAIQRAAATAAAEARAAAEIGALAKVANFAKGLVGGTLGVIGLALWGAYEIADHMGWIDKIFDASSSKIKALRALAGEDNGGATTAYEIAVAKAAKRAEDAAKIKAGADIGVAVTPGMSNAELAKAVGKGIEQLTTAGLGSRTKYYENLQFLQDWKAALESTVQVQSVALDGMQPPPGAADRWAALQQAHQTEAYKTAQLEIEKQKILAASYEQERALGLLSIADQKDRSAEIRAIQKAAQGQIADLYEKNKVAEKELSTFEKMSLANKQRLAELQLELNGNSKLLESEKKIADFKEAQAAGKTGMSAPHQAIALAGLEQIKLGEQALQADELQVKAMEKINSAGLTNLDRLDKEIAAQRLHNDSLGKSAELVAKLKATQEAATLAKMESDAKALIDGGKQDAVTLTAIANLDAAIAKEKEFAALKAAAPALEAAKAAEHEQKKLAESFTKHFNDAFSSVFSSGKSIFARLGEAFSASFKDVLSAFNKPMLDRFSAGGADVVRSLARSPMIASVMPYVAAAMLAMPMIGSLFSHQATAAQLNQVNPHYIQQWQGTGTVLGDIAAKSTSVAGSLDVLNKTTFAHTDYLAQMTTSMKSVDKGLSNFITVAGKALNLNMASQTPLGTTTSQNLSNGANFLLSAGVSALVTPIVTEALLHAAIMGTMGTMATDVAMTALGAGMGVLTMGVGLVLAPVIGSLLGGLFGSSSTSITGTGINIGGTTKQLQQGQGGQQYTSGVTTSDSWFGLSSSSSTWTQYAALDAKVTKAMGDIFKNIGDTIKVAGTVLGGNLATLTQQVDAFVITTGNISMAGMTVQQQQDALSSIISKQSDLMVAAIVPTMKAFQVAGEGLLQTLVRVVSEVATLTTFHRVLGDTTLVTAASADKLVTALGGIDAANQSMTKFVSTFAPETTKSALALNALEVALSNAGLKGIAPLIKTTQDYFALMQVASADQRVILLQQQDTALAYIKSVGSALNLMFDKASKLANTTKNDLGFVITNLSSLASSLKGAANSLYQSFMQQMTPDYQRQQYKASLALLQDAYTNYKTTGVAPNAAGLQQAISNVSQGGTQMFTSAVDWKRSTIQTIDLLSGMGNLADAQVTVLTQISGTMDKLLAANQEQLAAQNAGNLAAAADAANRAAALSTNLQWLQGVNTLVTNSAAQNTLVIDLVSQTVAATVGGNSALIDTLQKYITSAGTTMIGSGATTSAVSATSSAGNALPAGTAAGALNQLSGLSALSGFAASGMLSSTVAVNPLTAMLPTIQAANALASAQAAQAATAAAAAAAAAEAQRIAAHKAFNKANPELGYRIDFPEVDNAIRAGGWKNTAYMHWVQFGKGRGWSWGGGTGVTGDPHGIPPGATMDSFAVGSNYIPRDMTANIHAGEEITPRPYVDMQKAARNETNALLARLVASNDASQTELKAVRTELADIRRTNQNMDWTADKWDNAGMPAVRV